MIPPIARRRFLALSAAGAASLAGCQSVPFGNSKTPIRISVTNATDENREIWVQLSRKNASDPIGESVLLTGRTTTVLERTVQSDTYRLTASVDDPDPSMKRRVGWRITEQSCSTTGVITLTACGETSKLLLDTASCDGA